MFLNKTIVLIFIGFIKKKYWKFCGAQHKVSHFGFNLNQCSAQRAKIGQKMSFDHQRIE